MAERTFTPEERVELYGAAVKRWGKAAQLGVLQEEAAEVIVAVSKVLRHNDRASWDSLCEELADLEIMVEQVRVAIFDGRCRELCESIKQEKLRRLYRRLNLR